MLECKQKLGEHILLVKHKPFQSHPKLVCLISQSDLELHQLITIHLLIQVIVFYMIQKK